jgi:hypothetical protein
MPLFDRQLWRLAGRIQQRLASLPAKPIPSLDQSLWRSAGRLQQRRIDLAPRLWLAAREKLTAQLVCVIGRLQDQLRMALQALSEERHCSDRSQRFLYEELLATREEFADFKIDLRNNVVFVTTEEIELEGVEFGRFRIQLDFRDLAQGLNCYQVIALSPNRAACRDDVTHPHVTDDVLCEGEGTVPLQLALSTGRLSDFFLIIDRILRTYNSASAYVSLDDWDDRATCGCCGDRVSEYARYYCDACEHDTCEECSTSCSHCDNSACDSCIERCPDCDRQACASCLTPCRNCAQLCCPHCQTDSLCEECYDPETNEEETSSPTEMADAPVQPDRLGEALVPA